MTCISTHWFPYQKDFNKLLLTNYVNIVKRNIILLNWFHDNDAKNETKLRETLDADIRREINECFDNIINKIDIQALECEMSNEDGSDLENNKLMKKTYLEIIDLLKYLNKFNNDKIDDFVLRKNKRI